MNTKTARRKIMQANPIKVDKIHHIREKDPDPKYRPYDRYRITYRFKNKCDVDWIDNVKFEAIAYFQHYDLYLLVNPADYPVPFVKQPFKQVECDDEWLPLMNHLLPLVPKIRENPTVK